MKYVCTYCGKILPIDRDIDDDRTFEDVVDRHMKSDCPRKFLSSEDVTPSFS